MNEFSLYNFPNLELNVQCIGLIVHSTQDRVKNEKEVILDLKRENQIFKKDILEST